MTTALLKDGDTFIEKVNMTRKDNYFKVVLNLVKLTFQEWKDDKASRLAAGLAYYTIFALAPMVLVILSVIGLFMDQAVVGDLLTQQVSRLVGESGSTFFQTVVEVALEPKENNLLATIIGIVVAIIGATGIFVHLKDAINTVWGIEKKRFDGLVGLIRIRAISLTAILAIGFVLLVSLLFSTGLSAFLERIRLAGDTTFILGLLGSLVSLGMTTLVFALMYKYLPDAVVKWKDVWVGAFFTAVLFIIGNFAIGKYLGTSNLGELYGIAGSVLILLTWVYYSAQILLFGAEFTQVYSNKIGTRSLSLEKPTDGAKGSVNKPGADAVATPLVTTPLDGMQKAETAEVAHVVTDEEIKKKQDFWPLIISLFLLPFVMMRLFKPGKKVKS